MTSLSQLQSTLGEILDSTASLVQGRGRGGADGSLTWVDVVGGKRVQAKCFGRVAPGTCGVVQDRTGQWWAIGQGQGSVQTEQVQFYRHRARPTSTPESADVAVLLSCEKEDKYEYWITYLGNDRKDKFAFVGELPKRLQTEQYWAWESGQGGRFEFNPYTGATGGGISISTTPTNHDGAIIEAGPQGSFYQSEGWNGGGDKGGTVTPRWSKVLSDYEVTARTYLQTLCYPLTQYTDVTWEWSDGGGGYALKKIPGDGVTTSSDERKISTTWLVEWGYDGGGGSVEVSQEEEPRIKSGGEEVTIDTIEWTANGVVKTITGENLESEVVENTTPTSFVVKIYRDGVLRSTQTILGSSYTNGIVNKTVAVGREGRGRCSSVGGWYLVQVYNAESVSVIESYACSNRTTYRYLFTPMNGAPYEANGDGWDPYPWFLDWGRYQTISLVTTNTGASVAYSSVEDPQIFGFGGIAFWEETVEVIGNGNYNLKIRSNGNIIIDATYGSDPKPKLVDSVRTGRYDFKVFDEDGIEVASDSASSPISSTTEKIETKRVGFYIKKDGENINGQFDGSSGSLPPGFEDGDDVPEEYRNVEVRAGETAPTVTGETNLITAKIEAWVEVNEKELAKVELDGEEGQGIVESATYEEAIKPYTGPDGRTVYPCYPQKTDDPSREEKKSFQKSDGFNAYHITNYVSYDDNGPAEWVPFDFNNPGLSGTLPSPSINYLYSLISTDLLVSYDSVARLSWGADVPEENPETGETTNLEEEQIDGIDRNGVLYPLVKGFIYGLYGPIKASNTLLNQKIDKQAGQSLGNYDMTGWSYRNRARKPRTYVLGPDDFEEGEPFEEYDITDPNQRGLHQMQMTMGRTFRQSLWGYDLGPIGNEREEDWRHEAATFADVTSGGSTPNQRRFFNDPAFNSSNVRQSGDKRVDIKVNMDDVKALLKATERKDVRFLVYPEGGGNDTEPTEKTFKMNPIQDVFEGYEEVKILAVAGIIY